MTDENTPARNLQTEIKLTPDWCRQEMHNIDTEFLCFPEDGECECGMHKHHVHCTHGAIIQIG